VGDSYDQRYYYRAYAKAYDHECQREMVAYGITRSFTFAYDVFCVPVKGPTTGRFLTAD